MGLAGIGAAGLVGASSTALAGLLSSCSPGTGSPSGTGAQAGTGSAAGGAAESAQVVVVMNAASEPDAGFDPLVSWGCGEHVHEPLIQSTLVTTNAAMGFENDLATAYSCSDDGMTWTFTIRDDVAFTDGLPLTADDVAFTLNGIIGSQRAQADLSMVKEVEVADARTVVLRMAKPFNALLYTLAVVGIVPAHAYGTDYGSRPVGSGRYLLEQWDRGQQVILAANPDYYGTAPQIGRVVVVFMEEDVALAAVRTGQVDIAYTTALFGDQQIAGFELLGCKTVDSRGISLPTGAAGSTRAVGGIEYPSGNDVTSDVAVRRAVNHALDRAQLAEHVLNGYGSAAFSVSDNMPWASPDMVVPTDKDRARALLEGAGWVEGADGIRSKGTLRAAFTLRYPAYDSVRQALAAEFSNQMREVGIEVATQGGSWDDLYARQYTDPILWGWGSNSPIELYELNYSSGWGNFAGFEDAAIDAYLDAALAVPAIEDSYGLWQKAQWDGSHGFAPPGAATWAWLVNIDHLYFKRRGLNVADQKPHPHGHGWSLVNNIDRWSWDTGMSR
ncbi:MAG: ABC transporter substrate-binding protein [Coriobacteriaceae bacterium]|nr:ABC transporter substrate-binding protein [Coriobacteriaceae bacterium]